MISAPQTENDSENSIDLKLGLYGIEFKANGKFLERHGAALLYLVALIALALGILLVWGTSHLSGGNENDGSGNYHNTRTNRDGSSYPDVQGKADSTE